MQRTRLSLLYVAGYLSLTGIALMFAPQFTLKALLSNGDYGDVLPRFAGILMLALGLIVARVIYLRATVLYSTTLYVRLMIVVAVFGLYLHSKDPLFLVVLGVVGLGLILTGTMYLLDRRKTKVE